MTGQRRCTAFIRHPQADAFATLRDAAGCTTAISKARTHIERLQRDDDPPWLYWVGPAEVTARTGHCLLKLGKADRAAAMLDEGIALFDKSFVRDRTDYLIHLADVLTRPRAQRDLDAAAARGMAALDLAESLDPGRQNDLLRNLCHQMKPHVKLPAVADFLNRARSLVQA